MLASLLAGYLKDWIPLVASRYSIGMRRWRRRRLVAIATQIRRLKYDSHLFFALGIRLIFDFIAFFVVLLFPLIIGPIHRFYLDHPEYDPLRLVSSPASEFFIGIMIVIVTLFATPVAFRICRRGAMLARVDYEIQRPYNKRHKKARTLSRKLRQ
jgi:hypothetical protein